MTVHTDKVLHKAVEMQYFFGTDGNSKLCFNLFLKSVAQSQTVQKWAYVITCMKI